MPATDFEWHDLPRHCIDIRRSFVVNDALKEARKKRFNPSLLIKASLYMYARAK